MKASGIFGGAIAFAFSTLASPATYQPNTGINLAVSVPETTSSSGSGDVYIQFSAASSYKWAAFGIGEEMAGSTMFVIYADGTGNVTLSTRNGLGEFMPQFSPSINSETILLQGSGVANSMMVANIRFTTNSSTLATAGTSTNWISAWLTGDPIDSTSQSVMLQKHDAHAQFALDLSSATQAMDVNPFVAEADTSSTATATGSTASATGNATNEVSSPVATISSGSNKGVAVGPSYEYLSKLKKAHGIIMAITLIIIFPLGAMLIRLLGNPWIHAGVQILGLCTLVAGFGLGYRFADMTELLYKNRGQTHTIMGTVVFAFFLVQPVGGLLHHLQYKKIQKRGAFGYGHVWLGRAVIIIGVVNGGLGLRLANSEAKYEIAYGVVAGVVFLLYIAVFAITALKKGKVASIRRKGSVHSASSSTEPATVVVSHGDKEANH